MCVMTETVQRLAQRLAGLAARRSGLVVGLWGEAGIGKTHTSSALLRSTLCPSLSVHATQASEGIIGAVPRPKKPPVWLERSLERSRCGEPLEPGVFVQTLAGLLSANAPVILHVEDLHEAAPERLEVWKQLASAVTRTRGVGVIATSRTQPPDGFESVRLEPLRRVASDALLEAEAGTALPVEACSWIFEHARGNPLFTLEFFRFLARHGFVWNDGQRWRWRTPERQVMPVTVEAIIERIINEACADIATRTALNARAYLESLEPNLSFGFEVWAHVAGLELALLERSERNLRAWGILSELGFVHPLFREVGGKGLNVHERRSFANRALEVLPIRVAAVFVTDAKLGPGRSLELLERASRTAAADGRRIEAARLQARAAGYADGERCSSLALEAAQVLCLVDLPEASRLADLAAVEPALRERAVGLGAELLAVQGRLAEAERLLERLPDIADRNIRRLTLCASARDFAGTLILWRTDPDLSASDDPRVLRAVIPASLHMGRFEEARRLMIRAEALAGFDRADLLALEGFAVNLVFRDGEFEKALALYARRAANLIEDGDVRGAAQANHNQGVTLERLGRYTEAVARYDLSAQQYAELGDLRAFANSRTSAAWSLWHAGQYQEAETLLLEARELLARSEPTDYLVECEGFLSLLYLDWSPPFAADLAGKHALAALEAARQINSPNDVVNSMYDLVQARLRQGRADEALRLADEMEALRERHGIEGLKTNARYCRALALEALGRPEEALELMQSAEEDCQGPAMFKRKIGIEVARMSRDPRLARQHLEWFKGRGAQNGVNVLLRYFPELTDQGSIRPANDPAPRTELQLEVFGLMQFRRGGTVVPVRGAKRKELLALLLETRLSGYRERSKLDLLDALYPDSIEAQASAALSSLVYQLREQFGPNTILSTDGGYTLGGVTSDAEAFLEIGDTRLWRGEYLEGASFEGSDAVRETLHLALRHRAETLLETDPDEVARVGRLLCNADPYDLGGLHLTLRALRAAAKHKSLTRVYAKARQHLLEIGEVLPERWLDFLETPIGSNA